MLALNRIYALVALPLAVVLAACPGDSGTNTPAERIPTSVSIDKATASVDEGGTVQLTATVLDQKGVPFAAPPAGFTITWSSATSTVATVDGAGLVSGQAPGQAQVVATAGTLTASSQVTVNMVGGIIAGTITATDALQAVFSSGPISHARASGSLFGALGRKQGGLGRTMPVLREERAWKGTEYVPNTLVVTYRADAVGAPGARALARREVAAEVSGRVRARLGERLRGTERVGTVLPALRAARVVAAGPGQLDALRARLEADPGVERVEREALVRPAQAGGRYPNDGVYEPQAWNYMAIDLPRAWRMTTGSNSVIVAVIDDGIRFDHTDLAANLTTDGYDFVSTGQSFPVCGGGMVDLAVDGDGWDSNPTIPAMYSPGDSGDCLEALDEGGHGTHVAGTIGAVGNNNLGVTGVSWSVRIRPIRALGAGGGTLFDIASAILYSAGLPVERSPGQIMQVSRANVINMSLGGTGGSTTLCPAVTAATNAGSLVVAAAGNENTSTPSYPGACADAISVAAVSPALQRASYSNFGGTIDIAAPGGEISRGGDFGVLSTLWSFKDNAPLVGFYQGTSMAAPHVAGVAALLFAHVPGITAAQVRQRLLDFAIDLGPAGRDDQFGFGLVNARSALAGSHAVTRGQALRVIDAATGQVAVQASVTGSQFSLRRVPPGSYYVMAGQEEGGDNVFGQPGAGFYPRLWGGFAGGPRLTPLTVVQGSTAQAPITMGVPAELEPNNTPALAGRLVPGGYVRGRRSSTTDVDVYAITVPAGVYTFETSGWLGHCGWAEELDTRLDLFTAAGAPVASHDDWNADGYDFCSRLTQSLPAGTYLVSVTGSVSANVGRYNLMVRHGS